MSPLYPIETESREVKSLDGFWKFFLDTDDSIDNETWKRGLPADASVMPVPSSYNDISADVRQRDHVGNVWYETEFFVPADWSGSDVLVRFGSVTHHAIVWVNGQEITRHKGGYIPFGALVNESVKWGQTNRLVVRVNNVLDWTTLPPGVVEVRSIPGGGTAKEQNYFHDFFNYAGIHRPVKLVRLPKIRIEDIVVKTRVEGTSAAVEYSAEVGADKAGELSIRARLLDASGSLVAEGTGAAGVLPVEEAILWRPLNAYLYTLEIRLLRSTDCLDVYHLPVGIRTVEVSGSRFLINGEDFYFKGFGWHEDADLRGKGFDPVTIMRDLNLMRWIGANSFRTSHYPYAEETLRLADQLGMVVIAESPAVGLFDSNPNKTLFCEEKAGTAMKEHYLSVVQDMIARDRNHPSIVMWSVANEVKNNDPNALEFFSEVVEDVRKMDDRPITIVDHLEPEGNNIFSLSDVICINKYHGWYDNTGRLERVKPAFVDTFERLRAKVGDKPVILTEHGADTIAGMHEFPPVIFSEEFQTEWLRQAHAAVDEFDWIIGEHVWAFADFNTRQSLHRVNGNKKGIFTRQRQPKQAAFYLKDRWSSHA